MNTFPFRLHAVIEAPFFQDEFLCPWDIPPFNSLSRIRLSGEMTHEEIGLIFAQLVAYNHLGLSGEIQEILQRVLESNRLVLPGGIQVVAGNQTIAPSCCCGLETWREWQDFLRTGESPWLGHDPSPWLEQQGDLIRIWSDGYPGESVHSAFHVEVPLSAFRKELIRVERDLQGFLYSVDSWGQEVGFEHSSHLFDKLNQCFNISRRYTDLST